MLRIFDHALEIWNPGRLHPGLSIRDLKRTHESLPRNKLIATAFFYVGLIERFGQGTMKIVRLCREAGIPGPEFEERGTSFVVRFRKAETKKTPQVAPTVAPTVTPTVGKLLKAAVKEKSREELQAIVELVDKMHFIEKYLQPALQTGLIEYTSPDKPNSRLQRYRTTAAGRKVIENRRRFGPGIKGMG